MQVSLGKKIYDKYGTYIILVVLVIFFSIAGQNFFSVGNLTNILRTTAVYILFGCGMTFVMVSGKIDLSVGAVAALAGCATALCMKNGMGVIAASLVGIAVGLRLCERLLYRQAARPVLYHDGGYDVRRGRTGAGRFQVHLHPYPDAGGGKDPL